MLEQITPKLWVVSIHGDVDPRHRKLLSSLDYVELTETPGYIRWGFRTCDASAADAAWGLRRNRNIYFGLLYRVSDAQRRSLGITVRTGPHPSQQKSQWVAHTLHIRACDGITVLQASWTIDMRGSNVCRMIALSSYDVSFAEEASDSVLNLFDD